MVWKCYFLRQIIYLVYFIYDSSLLSQQKFRRNDARDGIENNICYDCMMDFRVMSVKL